MSDKKLNKNQMAFFEEAVKHFGSRSKSIKLAELNAFAETRGLTVATSFLKNHCGTGVRGIYDITESGVEVVEETGLFALDNEVPKNDVDIYEFEQDAFDGDGESQTIGVIETPAYADDIISVRLPEIFKTRDPITRNWNNPVYLIQDNEGTPRSICDSPKSAYVKCNSVLHGTHSLTEKQVISALDNHGVAIVVCTTATSLKAIITKIELNE